MKPIKGICKVQNNKVATYINIPKEIVEALKIEKGNKVMIEAFEDGTIVIKTN